MWNNFYYLCTLAAMTLYHFPQAEQEISVEAVDFVRQFTIFLGGKIFFKFILSSLGFQ